MWSYVDLAGTSTDLTSTTNANTGVSTIQGSITQPGYYSCEVTENGGTKETYTVGILNTNMYTGSILLTYVLGAYTRMLAARVVEAMMTGLVGPSLHTCFSLY